MDELEKRVRAAVRHFWKTRLKQGKTTGKRDQGKRAAATGGKQLDGFVDLFAQLLAEAGVPESDIHKTGKSAVTIPGYFRPTKQWDLLVMADGRLLAAVECKSLCGPSFGNNYNNRVEEAIGSATDIWTAYREGLFQTTPRPVLAYLLLLEESDASTRGVSLSERHFKVEKGFRGASYLQRCAITVERLVRERCYDVACFLTSKAVAGSSGVFNEPSPGHSFRSVSRELCTQVMAKYESIQNG